MDAILFQELSDTYSVVYSDAFVAVFSVPSVREDARGKIFVPTDVHPRWNHVASVPLLRVGDVRGRHAHVGLAETKNPESFLLVAGEVDFFYAPLRATDELQHGFEEAHIDGALKSLKIAPGMLVCIELKVYHEVVAVSDGALLMEMMMDPEDINFPDVVRLKK